MHDDEYAIAESPERAVTRPLRKGSGMKARILKKWGGFYAGQILSNVEKSHFPDGVAEIFEDDDPAINTVREPSGVTHENVVNDDEVAPLKGSDFAKAQEAKVKAVQDEHEAQQSASVDVLNTNVASSEKAPTPKSAKAGTKGKGKK